MHFKLGLIVFALIILGCSLSCLGQSAQQGPVPAREQQGMGNGGASPPVQPSGNQAPGSITGTVVDQSSAVVAGARIRLTKEDQPQAPETTSGTDGQFYFASVVPGPFHLTVTAAGFASQTCSGFLHPGESYTFPKIMLDVASNLSEVDVTLTQTELAEKEIKLEEKQRVLGVVPNFYVSYIPDAVPLTRKQKFELAWKTVIDPITFLMVGGAAGVEQWQNHFAAYGQGAQGYGKRFGAGYADTVSGTYIGGAILPSLLKQDPRYFYKGTGSKRSRFIYAIANAFICKGDNRRWQPNYSNILGSVAAGGISNIYYPAQDRDGLGLTFENAAIGLGASAVSNLLQEFILRRFTPKANKVSNSDPTKP
jgi:Carboxypeptidase regulatory-like domain